MTLFFTSPCLQTFERFLFCNICWPSFLLFHYCLLLILFVKFSMKIFRFFHRTVAKWLPSVGGDYWFWDEGSLTVERKKKLILSILEKFLRSASDLNFEYEEDCRCKALDIAEILAASDNYISLFSTVICLLINFLCKSFPPQSIIVQHKWQSS